MKIAEKRTKENKQATKQKDRQITIQQTNKQAT